MTQIKKLYDSGAKGCAESNICNGSSNLAKLILVWEDDEDEDNFPSVGHRRWLLSPTMKNTGIGYVGDFYAMHVFDGLYEKTNVKNLAWPCQNMPIEFFGDNYPWSLLIGQILKKK